MAKISKRKQAANEIDRTRSYPLAEAVSMIKASAAASKFDETIEIAMNLGVDPRHADQMVRGVIAMPKNYFAYCISSSTTSSVRRHYE